ncbi:hypothetical protein AGMMS50276_14600 [Synergistales bacterium]|nr:hypothetical protein AGMMS50276_14600 [Synergistales bacterium]
MLDTFNFRNELGKMTPKIAEGAKIYIFGAGGAWEDICKQYKYLVNIDLNTCIDGFIDNDTNKQGSQFHGKPVYALSNVALDNAVVMISSWKWRFEIVEQLTSAGLFFRHSFFTGECFMALLMRWEYLRLLQFKDKHKGERCFVIGNGPSLTSSDLDKIKDEVTFATNKIYLMFDKTEWRPSYYAIADDVFLKEAHKLIKDKITCPIFYAYNYIFEFDEFSLNNDYFYCVDGRADYHPYPYNKPDFSEEPFMLQWGSTVTYSCLQLAAYMGFSEITLIGVDNTSLRYIDFDGTLHLNDSESEYHFSQSYDESPYYVCMKYMWEPAYQSARDYCEAHGIKIRNATRGGELEIFERVDFDSLF